MFLFLQGLVERVAVIFSGSNNVPIERFVFKINVNQSYGSKLEEADLAFSLKSFLIKLPLSQSLMKVLPPGKLIRNFIFNGTINLLSFCN